MSKLLIEALVNKLLDLTPVEKESVGNRITEALGGDPTKKAPGLPKRRGNQDGGIDGRVPVYRKVVRMEAMLTESGREEIVSREEPVMTKVEAGITIKLEGQTFSAERLGGFKIALERENLRDGIIITARGLSPDAAVYIEKLHKDTVFRFIAPTLGDFLSQSVPDSPIEFVCDPNQAIRSALQLYLDNT